MDLLPSELKLEIVSYLDPHEVAKLASVSRKLHKVCRENGDLWRQSCFDATPPHWRGPFSRFSSGAPPTADGSDLGELPQLHPFSVLGAAPDNDEDLLLTQEALRTRAMANWDPTYPGERVDWYGEYVARHGALSCSWLEPVIPPGLTGPERLDVKGLGMLNSGGEKRVVAPLDDGSVCLWDITQHLSEEKRGRVVARSDPQILTLNGSADPNSTKRANRISPGVVECINVDSTRQKAYIAVQSSLHEIDLHTLKVSAIEKFPYLISALSDYDEGLPITVGTTLSLHLYDPRQAKNSVKTDTDDARLDSFARIPKPKTKGNTLVEDLRRILNEDSPSEYASMFQPGPLSIVHLNPRGSGPASGEIYVGGRFPSILVHDRRTFPKLMKILYSGASLCSMTTLPYNFNVLEADLMYKRQLSVMEAQLAKSKPGNRLFAVGEYNGKGSLEIYGLSPETETFHKRRQATNLEREERRNQEGDGSSDKENEDDHITPAAPAGAGQTSSFKNRVSASRSKLLSIANHGTRIVVSDGDGNLRWLERDGNTLVRAWNINPYGLSPEPWRSSYSFAPQGSEVVRKLLPVHNGNDDSSLGNIAEDEILAWTGDLIGVIGFSVKPRFGRDDWIETTEGENGNGKSIEELRLEKMRREDYEREAREALRQHANEQSWMRTFGLPA